MSYGSSMLGQSKESIDSEVPPILFYLNRDFCKSIISYTVKVMMVSLTIVIYVPRF